MHSELTAVVLLFGAALLAASLMRLLRAPSILGFLLAGIAIGSSGFDLIPETRVHFFAELGLVLLLFNVGLELSPAPLLRSGRRLLLAGGVQIVATSVITAIALRAGLAFAWPAAIIVGLAVASSSTAIVLKNLSDRGEADTPAGTIATGVLLMQDVCVILALSFLPLAAIGSGGSWSEVTFRAGLALGSLVGVTVLARLAMPWLVKQVFRHGGQELMTLFAVVVACTGAWLANLANWSWALGSCIAGLALAQTDLRHQLYAEIAPFRDAFNALFFISIGMLVDIQLFAEQPIVLLGVVLGTLVLKSLLAGAAVVITGWPVRLAAATGLALCTISEFGYVLAKEATDLHLLPPEFMGKLVACTAGTMLLGAVLLPLAGPIATSLDRLVQRLSTGATAEIASEIKSRQMGHVIIVGYGLNGQNLASVLRATGIQFCVIEMNRTTAPDALAIKSPVIIGDGARSAILTKAGIATARALVISISDQHATRRIVAQAHAARPDLYILARTRYVSELDTLYRLGAAQVIPEEFETSIEIFAHVLKEFVVPGNVIDQQINLIRAGRYGMLRGRPTDRALRAEWLRMLEESVTQTYMLMTGSPAVGRSIRELDFRAQTGVTIVAVTRAAKATPNPSPDFKLEIGDVLVLVGTHKQLDLARLRLDPDEQLEANRAAGAASKDPTA